MKTLQDHLKRKLCELLKSEFDPNPDDIQFTIPPNREFGDLSTTIPFVLAKKLKQKPFAIGNRIIELIKTDNALDMFGDIKLAGGGFLNFYFKTNFLLNYLSASLYQPIQPKNQKVVVEHTSINPNKSAHIGHLRNACIGDILARSLKFLGYDVEIQNYLDDTGIQVADVVWGLMYYQGKNLDEIMAIPQLASYLWYLYPEVTRLFDEDERAKEGRNAVHKKIEEKINPEYEVSNFIAEEVLKDHIRVMNTIDVQYDLLVRESDIITLDFFKETRDILENKGILYPSADPGKKGCMVIKYRHENIEKIVIRSNGTVTYIGKDIAYTTWKVGLFNRDFYYKEFYAYSPGNKKIHITDYHPHPADKNPIFGGGESVFNVIDVRQSYLQNIISQVLNDISPADHQKKFFHFSYERVALTPRCVEDMGFDISPEEKNKPYVEVSGRKGIGIKANELVDQLAAKSIIEVQSRHPEMDEKTVHTIARQIAIGALRYFMIKFHSNSVIAFDFKDALAFEGETGPYLQYTVVRINSILNKLRERGDEVEVKNAGLDMSTLDQKEYKLYYEILLELSTLELQVEMVLNAHELSGIPNYAYSVSQKFNQYYHQFQVASEKNPQIKQLRLQLVLLTRKQLEKLLGIMGIPIPGKM